MLLSQRQFELLMDAIEALTATLRVLLLLAFIVTLLLGTEIVWAWRTERKEKKK